MKKDTRLYNVMFPIWMMIFFPPIVLFVIPVNFIIDLLVLAITLKVLKLSNIKENLKKTAVITWILGFVADILGSVLMIIPSFIFDYLPGNVEAFLGFRSDLMYNPFNSTLAFIYTALCVGITGVLIYRLNMEYSLSRLDIEIEKKKKIALSLAIFTAPYLFLLPVTWFAR